MWSGPLPLYLSGPPGLERPKGEGIHLFPIVLGPNKGTFLGNPYGTRY